MTGIEVTICIVTTRSESSLRRFSGKPKRLYLLTCEVNKYCRLALHGSIVILRLKVPYKTLLVTNTYPYITLLYNIKQPRV